MFFWKKTSQYNFSYLLEKITLASFKNEPFKHLYIEDFFSSEHFNAITASPEIKIPPARDDEDLIEKLHAQNYREIQFPGTTTDLASYIKWHSNRENAPVLNNDTCEGFGVTFRLMDTKNGSILHHLSEFLKSDLFWQTLTKKFALNIDELRPDVGIQKYLDGYEISPHPDIRHKALTFMANINPAANSESLDFHTHYMRFTPEHAHIQTFWDQNEDVDRCWVPWSWCTTQSRQTKNNSIVIFSPANDTLHAIKAAYDHLPTQRTQLYGNLWFKEKKGRQSVWQELPSPIS